VQGSGVLQQRVNQDEKMPPDLARGGPATTAILAVVAGRIGSGFSRR